MTVSSRRDLFSRATVVGHVTSRRSLPQAVSPPESRPLLVTQQPSFTPRHKRWERSDWRPLNLASIAMASNEKRGVRSDELKELLSSAVTNYNSAEVALLHLMREYDFDLNTLRQTLAGPSIVS
jgi:hypothetical protein